MSLTEQVRILDDNIKANKAQYDLDRKLDQISALSSGELEKHEYLTGEDLGYKPDATQKANLEYCPLGKTFNKGLDESDKKGLFKRLKNIEGKNEQQLDPTKDGQQLQTIKDEHLKLVNQINYKKNKLKRLRYVINKKDKEEVKHFEKLVKLEKATINYNNLHYQSGNKNKDAFDFEEVGTIADLFQRINSERITLEN